ncbi:hypothetical protein TDB9533_01864 [Thalassocella blandensis]|nr:hypothetical protein TDB9533_01864 [Thalassocella blandensis]
MKSNSGFTLIEILVVVMIVGIMAGATTAFVSTGGPKKEMNTAIEKFVVISDHIQELALLDGEPIGLILEPREWRDNPLDQGWLYRWQKMTAQGWQALPNVDQMEFPVEVDLRVIIDEMQWKHKKEPEIKEPILAFYPSGEVTPFEIEFSHEELPGESQTVMVNVWGQVVWKEREEAEKERDELLERYD